jgi:hypothetical protein
MPARSIPRPDDKSKQVNFAPIFEWFGVYFVLNGNPDQLRAKSAHSAARVRSTWRRPPAFTNASAAAAGPRATSPPFSPRWSSVIAGAAAAGPRATSQPTRRNTPMRNEPITDPPAIVETPRTLGRLPSASEAASGSRGRTPSTTPAAFQGFRPHHAGGACAVKSIGSKPAPSGRPGEAAKRPIAAIQATGQESRDYAELN